MHQSPNVLLKSIAVPGWIYRAVLQAKRSAADLSNYGTLRQFLSIDDFAQWWYVNNGLKIDNLYFTDAVGGWRFFDGLASAEEQEIQNSVAPLSGSEEIASSVKTRLTLDKNSWQAASVQDVDYEFVLLDNKIYVILHEGFLKTCEDPQKRLAFVRDYLKKCYSMTSIADVSRMAVFTSYVNHLAN